MILSGEKKEDYRERKEYWETRFLRYFGKQYDFSKPTADCIEDIVFWNKQPKIVCFRNGYRQDSPSLLTECVVREGTGKEAWGAVPGEIYYILEIGKIIERKGC